MGDALDHPIRWLSLFLLLAVGFVGFLFLWGPTTAEIRLDTGDLRFFCLGIPVEYRPMHEPQRTLLLKIAAQPYALAPQWRSCPLQVGSNNVDVMLAEFYARAANWTAVDPRISRIMLEDIANYIQTTGAREGLPGCSYLFQFNEVDTLGNPSINSGWRQDEVALDYLKSKGYVPPSTQPANG